MKYYLKCYTDFKWKGYLDLIMDESLIDYDSLSNID